MKTDIIRTLRKLFAISAEAHQHKYSLSQVLDEHLSKNSRRTFLKKYATAGIVAGLTPHSLINTFSQVQVRGKARIGIVGAGVAGLTAAYYLKQRGVEGMIFEASKRPGGRIISKYKFGENALVTEIGAEFIDSSHKDILSLINKLGLKQSLLDLETDNFGEKEVAYIDGRHYHVREIIEELYSFYPEIAKIKRDINKSGFQFYDNLSLAEYLETMPISKWLRKLIEVGFVGENGAEASEQSAAIMLSTLEMDKNDFRMYGESDERFKLKGGNELIIKNLAETIESEIYLEHRLIEVNKKANDEVVLTFDQSGSIKQYTFDFVILCIPFTILREVKIKFDISVLKKRVINELGYGSNTKFIIETKNSPWRKAGYQGYLFNDIISNGWDSSQLQFSNNLYSTYTCYLGGRIALEANPGNEKRLLNEFGSILDSVYGGFQQACTGNTELAYWPGNPLIRGSYSYFKPGQFTNFSELAAQPVGNIYFAGEHTSSRWGGFMNGAVESGRKAAIEIIQKLPQKNTF